MKFETQIKKSINRYAYNATKEDKEDLFQECYIRLMDVSEDKPASYINKICRNLIIDKFRHDRNEVNTESLSEPDVKYSVDFRTAQHFDFDSKMDVDKVLRQLPAVLNEILRFRFGIEVPKKTREQVAKMYNKTVRWVRYNEEIALHEIAKLLKENQ